LPAALRKACLLNGLRNAAVRTRFDKVSQISAAIGAGFQNVPPELLIRQKPEFFVPRL
jgi:hypothetical protein